MSDRNSLKYLSVGLFGFFLLGIFIPIYWKKDKSVNASNISEQLTKDRENKNSKTSYPKVNKSLKEYYPIDRFTDEELTSEAITNFWGSESSKSQNAIAQQELTIVSEFYEGLAKFEQDGKYGYVDEQGNIAVAAKYDEAGNFSEQLAAVVLDGQSFFIDGAGKVVIALDDYDVYTNYVEILANSGDASSLYYDYIYTLSEFKNGVAEVSKPTLPRDYQYKTIEEANAPKEFLCNEIDRTGKIIGEDRLCEIESG